MTFTAFDSAKAVLLCGVLASFAGWVFYRQRDNGLFLLQIFVGALLIRVLLGTIIFMFNGREFFGGDAIHYDYFGFAQLGAWQGDRYFNALMGIYISGGLAGAWGMVYMVAAIYGLLGRNVLAVQMVVAVMGAATAPVIYLCRFTCLSKRQSRAPLRVRRSFLSVPRALVFSGIERRANRLLPGGRRSWLR